MDQGSRLADRHAREIGDEFRERRLELNRSQASVAAACQISRVHYGEIERAEIEELSLREVSRIAAVLGLRPTIRLFPAGPAIRDAGQTSRLQRFLAQAASPLTYRLEVALPARQDRPEQRAWDAVLFGHGARTTMELEMRIRDVQAMRRRHELKRRDDRAEQFLLLIADTKHNRRVLAEFADLFGDLPRLRPSVVRRALAAGEHPPTGLLLV